MTAAAAARRPLLYDHCYTINARLQNKKLHNRTST